MQGIPIFLRLSLSSRIYVTSIPDARDSLHSMLTQNKFIYTVWCVSIDSS
jgi:hypothetical protein